MPNPVLHWRLLVLCGLLCAPLGSAGCGYALAGRGSFLPAYIRTIGIPVLENNTKIFELDETLTAQIRKEFIGRGRYNVLPDAEGADAVLRGEVLSVTISPTGFNQEQQASRYNVSIRAKIEFRDVKTNKLIWSNEALTFSEEYQVATSGEAVDDAEIFFGQETDSLERLWEAFARAVASAIMESF